MSVKTVHKSPREYDLSINWSARLRREIPVLKKLFGPPGKRPVLDAGCGTGRHAVALARRGYHVVATDKSAEMIRFARTLPGADSRRIEWRVASFAQLSRRCPGPVAGLYCIGNSLSAGGSATAIQKALRNFAAVLSPKGKLFIQVLNYPPMRKIIPCVKGPTHYFIGGVEHLRFRVFDFARTRAKVTNVTLRRDGEWTFEAMRGHLFAFSPAQLQRWCRDAGLHVVRMWGDYAGRTLDLAAPGDVILIARPKKRAR